MLISSLQRHIFNKMSLFQITQITKTMSSYMVVGRGSTRGRRGPTGPAIRTDVAVARAIAWEGPAGALAGPNTPPQQEENQHGQARRAITWEGTQAEGEAQPSVHPEADQAESAEPQVMAIYPYRYNHYRTDSNDQKKRKNVNSE